jgi:hypothetical protein
MASRLSEPKEELADPAIPPRAIAPRRKRMKRAEEPQFPFRFSTWCL